MLYNQYNYKSIPYPHKEHPNANIRTSGCGVCAMATVVEHFLGDNTFPIDKAAEFAIVNGARESTGTNMVNFANAIQKVYDIRFTLTNDIKSLYNHIKKGGIAIANTGGNRTNYNGLFSDSGHYIVINDLVNEYFQIFDPAYYEGKYDRFNRNTKVTINKPFILCPPQYLDKDCETRIPRYYLFTKPKQYIVQCGVFNSKNNAEKLKKQLTEKGFECIIQSR